MREYGSSSLEPEWTFFFRVPVVYWPVVVVVVFGPEIGNEKTEGLVCLVC